MQSPDEIEATGSDPVSPPEGQTKAATDEVVKKVEEVAAKSGAGARAAADEAREQLVALFNPALRRYHGDSASLGIRLANSVTGAMGSWRFIIIQSALVAIWVSANVIGLIAHWDPYPFILLNLMFSVQAAYASPLILMAGNVAAARDRDLWEHDYKVNQQAYAKIEAIEIRTQEMVRSIDRILSTRTAGTEHLG